ncbi:hypothetical protein QBC41DRAFT_8160 [Cercophora samala]|uniref:Uncharacterized protein n=1 Tax=Cercophora samala TaxID=330535 RepID=A0AA40D7A7_9PEZI|nr:hypothetical protein QBC41DRAFT_8160 [Cercophora samala]
MFLILFCLFSFSPSLSLSPSVPFSPISTTQLNCSGYYLLLLLPKGTPPPPTSPRKGGPYSHTRLPIYIQYIILFSFRVSSYTRRVKKKKGLGESHLEKKKKNQGHRIHHATHKKKKKERKKKRNAPCKCSETPDQCEPARLPPPPQLCTTQSFARQLLSMPCPPSWDMDIPVKKWSLFAFRPLLIESLSFFPRPPPPEAVEQITKKRKKKFLSTTPSPKCSSSCFAPTKPPPLPPPALF